MIHALVALAVWAALLPSVALADHTVAGLEVQHAAQVPGDHWSAVTFDLTEPSRLSWEVIPSFGDTPHTVLGLYVLRPDGSVVTFAAAPIYWEQSNTHVHVGPLGDEPVVSRQEGSASGWTSLAVTTGSAVAPGRYTALAYAISENAEATRTLLYAADGALQVVAEASDAGLILARAEQFRGTASAGDRRSTGFAMPSVHAAVDVSFGSRVQTRLTAHFGGNTVGTAPCAYTVEGPEGFRREGCPILIGGAPGGEYTFRVERFVTAGPFAGGPVVHGADWYPPVEVARDLPYSTRDGATLRLDAYRPPGGTGLPAVLAVPGERWDAGDRAGLSSEAARLAAEGFAVFVPAYRATHPAAVHDLEDALGWVRADGVARGADPSRVGALGAGAGGHLAQLLATTTAADGGGVAAAVSWSGPSHLPLLVGTALEEAAETYLGCAFSGCPERWEQASPLAHVGPHAASTYLANSDQEVVPVDGALEMAAALSDLGVPNVLRLVPGDRHGRAYLGEVWRESVAFLSAHLA